MGIWEKPMLWICLYCPRFGSERITWILNCYLSKTHILALHTLLIFRFGNGWWARSRTYNHYFSKTHVLSLPKTWAGSRVWNYYLSKTLVDLSILDLSLCGGFVMFGWWWMCFVIWCKRGWREMGYWLVSSRLVW